MKGMEIVGRITFCFALVLILLAGLIQCRGRGGRGGRGGFRGRSVNVNVIRQEEERCPDSRTKGLVRQYAYVSILIFFKYFP